MRLFDADVLVDAFRGYEPALRWMETVRSDPLLIPGFARMELLHGCRSRADARRIEGLLAPFGIVWPSAKACEQASHSYIDLHLAHGVSILDCLIAYTALELNLPLHTFNERHYAPISGLKTVQPYHRP